MALTAEELKEIAGTLGTQAAEKIQTDMKVLEKTLLDKQGEVSKGMISKEDFETFKTEQLSPINVQLKKLEDINKTQGEKINELITSHKGKPGTKTLESFIVDLGPEIKKMRDAGGFVTFTGEQLKAAGIYTIAGTIPTPSPFAPGIGGAPLDIFDIIRNPNFITSKVDLGSTTQAKLAWINEIDYQGVPALVNEGAAKPQTQHLFDVQLSTAKKIATYIRITEELDDDLPQLGTMARRMIQTDVERAWDDQIQLDVQAAALPYTITGLNGAIQAANNWDALFAQMAQIGFYNFTPNTVAINWLTNVLVQAGQKTTQNEYLLPPFADDIKKVMAFANKLAVGYGLVGDLKQYHVDIYKDFNMKIGWINDDLIHNQFAIVGEMRYHSYISEARQKAICYDSLAAIAALIL